MLFDKGHRKKRSYLCFIVYVLFIFTETVEDAGWIEF